MKATTSVKALFHCSIERAFQAPILGDATRFLDGYLLQPPVVGFEEDETWGRVNGMRYPVISGNFLVKPGRVFTDQILVRTENRYWKWTVYEMRLKALFFVEKGVGEWLTEPLEEGTVRVTYSYSYFAKQWLYMPLIWLFVKVQIRGMMKQAITGIQLQAESGEPFKYTNEEGNLPN